MTPKNSSDKAVEAPEGVSAAIWTAGNGSLQVPVSGLLVHKPELQDATLTVEEWQKELDAYLKEPA